MNTLSKSNLLKGQSLKGRPERVAESLKTFKVFFDFLQQPPVDTCTLKTTSVCGNLIFRLEEFDNNKKILFPAHLTSGRSSNLKCFLKRQCRLYYVRNVTLWENGIGNVPICGPPSKALNPRTPGGSAQGPTDWFYQA